MIELPEATVLAQQITHTLSGKRILRATANQSPHKFGWYTGDPALYNQHLAGAVVGRAFASGGHVEVEAGGKLLVLSVNLRYHLPGDKLPPKHQLLLEFEDASALSGSVQMWGCMLCVAPGESGGLVDIAVARQKPSPLSSAFDRVYFDSLFDENTPRLAAKAFLATEQRIPGLGNGVLQDILWTARIHPRRKMADLTPSELDAMFSAVKSVLKTMVDQGGRDTERDLYGCPGRYRTVLSKNTAGAPCPVCSSLIRKEAFLGGSIYYCPVCQPLQA